MNLSKIKDIILKNKKLIIMGVFVFAMFFPEISFAAVANATNTTTTDQNEFDKVLSLIVGLLQFIIYLFSAIAGVITFMVGMFLSPEWTTGSIFGMTKYLKDMWILVSNIVYFIFAFLLIVIAFMNIVGKGGEWELKQALPRFIVGVLIVPFSWFFIQFMLSLSSILTVSVLSLPSDSFTDYTKKLEDEKIICKEYKINFEKIGNDIVSESSKGNKVNESTVNNVMGCEDEKNKMSIATLLQNNPFGILTVYTYGVMDFESIDKLKSENFQEGIKKLGDLFQKGLFDILFAAIYLILLVTLGLVMMIRGFYLWIFMMISPVFGLLYFFKGKEGESFKDFNIKTFFGLAMVPVYVSAALSFGLLFIVTVSSQNPDIKSQEHSTVVITSSGFTLGQGAGQVTINMTGLGQGSKGAAKAGSGLLNAGKGILGKLIMEIFAIVVLWMAVMAAFKSSTMTEAITKPIADFGNSIGSLAKSAPSYLPVFGGHSAAGLQTIGNTMTGHYSGKASTKRNEFLGQHGLFGQTASSAEAVSKSAEALGKLKSGVNNQSVSSYKDAMYKFDNTAAIFNNKDMIEGAKKIAETLGLDKKLYEKIDTKDDYTKLIAAIDRKMDNDRKDLGNLLDGRNGNQNIDDFKEVQLNKILKDKKETRENTETSISNPTNSTINVNIGNKTPKEIDLDNIVLDKSTKMLDNTNIQKIVTGVGEVKDIKRDEFTAGLSSELIKKLNIIEDEAKAIANAVANAIEKEGKKFSTK